ncbi:ACP S-malonyltransferase [Falsigemmobacter faecalis]|uniref:Uncharacterized protein n=1 Tax=Falsigemmobacter faecalis TaxID=2488730 RepID=A0A3P3DSR7_9RHOB|nr:hypothetical protein [Falsigemmobacter faecalis]RRH77300.1 hypothetical protein EG244_03650 [Falsigemmobacter faecalis]
MRQALYIGSRITLFGAGLATALWGWSQQPLTAALVERSAESAGRAIEAAFQRSFTPEEAAARIRSALAADDAFRALWLADLAEEEAIALPPDVNLEIEALRASREGVMAGAKDCAVCAWDIRACASLSEIAFCALPVEMTPLGDLNALRRQGANALAGQEVDQLETGLALVGLAATSALLVTGGGSALVKAGATALRGAKRLGSLTPGVARMISGLGDLPIRWSAVLRGAPLDEITDAARLTRVTDMAADIGRIAGNTSAAETLLVLRHVETAEDAARLARVSDVAKAKTTSRLEVLGKSRIFRATLRLSDTAIAAFAALWAGITGLLSLVAGWLMQGVLKLLRPPPQRRGWR